MTNRYLISFFCKRFNASFIYILYLSKFDYFNICNDAMSQAKGEHLPGLASSSHARVCQASATHCQHDRFEVRA
jgi:hypothetical protein